MQATLIHVINSREKIVAIAKLHNIGEQEPYFSLTGEAWQDGRINCCGCMHEELLKHWPQLQPLVDLHLSTKDGVPMHAVENGWYWAGGNKEWCKGEPSDPPRADYLASLLRVSLDEARRIIQCVSLGEMDKPEFTWLVEAQKPRWQAEATAGIELINNLAQGTK